jgi:hypothetical protein
MSGRSLGTWSSIWGSSAGRESSARRRQSRAREGVSGGGDDVGRCLTYIEKSLEFVLGFRVSPWINRLVGVNGLGKRECKRTGKRAMVWKSTGPWQGIDPKS